MSKKSNMIYCHYTYPRRRRIRNQKYYGYAGQNRSLKKANHRTWSILRHRSCQSRKFRKTPIPTALTLPRTIPSWIRPFL